MKTLTFQQIIAELSRFWADQGCIIQQPYDMEKGAGTMNPATFFRVLGPEPFNVAYVEPSRRPTDGRYGENPNRLFHYYQFQVILKPSPLNIQELYLSSLKAIGVDPAKHDVRFVEDNWESPTLGAWGVGWEVWAEGMEITQFTYFQQSGGVEVKPVSVEITYGLERLAMFIQQKDSVFDIDWNEKVTYGQVHQVGERQHSVYNFEIADTQLLARLFNDFEAEAKRCLDAKLTLPAYDYVLKCSHVFNLLDARGAVSVTERMAFILRVRKLAQQAAKLYLLEREEQGYPLLKKK